MSKKIRLYANQREATNEVVSLCREGYRIIGGVDCTVVLRHVNGNVIRVVWQ